MGTALESVRFGARLAEQKSGGKLCAHNCPSPVALESCRGITAAQKNKPIMTYRSCQNILLIGSLLLLLDVLFLPSLVEKWGAVDRVGGLPQLNTPTVAAAKIVKVWVYKKTGLYFCPDSKVYGKAKPGVYMSQEKALGRGYRPAGGDPCR